MLSFKRMMCELLYRNHVLGQGSVHQIGYDDKTCQWLYIIECTRCEMMSIVTRHTLDKMIFKDVNDGRSK